MTRLPQPKTRKEIAHELGMSYSTFKRWLRREQIHLPPGLLLPSDQARIYRTYRGEVGDSPDGQDVRPSNPRP